MADLGENEEWMKQLSHDFRTRSLNTITIPGSHNSFTYCLDSSGPLAPEYSEKILKWARRFRRIANPIVRRWAVTQSWTVPQQLRAGIRYFDVRVSAKGADPVRDYFASHGLFGNIIRHHMAEISDFISAHRTEVVLVDFNHFYDMDENDHMRLISIIQEVFIGKLCPRMPVLEMTLNSLIAASHQVIVFYHHHAVTSCPLLWPGHFIPSHWPNVTSSRELIHRLEANYATGKPSDTFHVTQGILTPSTGHVVRHSTRTLKATLCRRAANAFVEWLRTKSPGGASDVNVCLMDFVEMSDFIPVVIGLNNIQ